MIETTLILPDLHLKVEQADKIIKHVGADKIICVGDVFDDFGDNPESVRNAAEWFVDFVNNPNHIFLVGNHEQHYAYSYRTFQCSGYEQWKYFLINDIVPRSVWDKLKWFHFLDGRWLLCHGGLHKLNVPDSIKKFRQDRPKFVAELTGWLDHEIIQGFQAGANGQGSWVFNAGRARWGQQRVGGITWCDFEREFYPLRGINQIVGHTPQMQGPKWCILENDPLNSDGKVVYRPYDLYKPTLAKLDDPDLSHNICLDVHGNMHWATWNGKELKLGSYLDL
jgi:predicted phosphodiesterase